MWVFTVVQNNFKLAKAVSKEKNQTGLKLFWPVNEMHLKYIRQ